VAVRPQTEAVDRIEPLDGPPELVAVGFAAYHYFNLFGVCVALVGARDQPGGPGLVVHRQFFVGVHLELVVAHHDQLRLRGTHQYPECLILTHLVQAFAFV